MEGMTPLWPTANTALRKYPSIQIIWTLSGVGMERLHLYQSRSVSKTSAMEGVTELR